MKKKNYKNGFAIGTFKNFLLLAHALVTCRMLHHRKCKASQFSVIYKLIV